MIQRATRHTHSTGMRVNGFARLPRRAGVDWRRSISAVRGPATAVARPRSVLAHVPGSRECALASYFRLQFSVSLPTPRVFAHLRVSTAEQAANGDSLATQRQQIAGYAMMRGWPEPEWFIDRGVSGSVPLADRPEGKRLLEAVETGDVIITAKLDRAFRSAADALGTLEELKDQGVGLHMIDLGGDVTGNGISKLVFTILSAVTENERDRIRERIRDVKRHLASQGIYGGGKRPFGYNVVDGRLVTNANERRAIARMRALHAEGKPLREISKLIANEFKVEMTAIRSSVFSIDT
jgi:putative DNA-invertase from lambdoid prophage Rac